METGDNRPLPIFPSPILLTAVSAISFTHSLMLCASVEYWLNGIGNMTRDGKPPLIQKLSCSDFHSLHAD